MGIRESQCPRDTSTLVIAASGAQSEARNSSSYLMVWVSLHASCGVPLPPRGPLPASQAGDSNHTPPDVIASRLGRD